MASIMLLLLLGPWVLVERLGVVVFHDLRDYHVPAAQVLSSQAVDLVLMLAVCDDRGILMYRTGTFTSGHTGIAALFVTSKTVARGRARTQLVRMYEEDRGTAAPDTIAAGIVTQRAFACSSE